MVHLLLIGNSGVGKSFIGNALLKREVFMSSFSAQSVTSAAQTATLSFATSASSWVLVDMPGLMEADSGNFQRNEREIANAFAMTQGQPVIVAFIITLEGGRMKDAPMIMNVMRNVNGLTAHNTFVVVNKVDDEISEGSAIRTAVRDAFPTLSRTVLVPRISLQARRDPACATIAENVCTRVLNAALQCTPCPVSAGSIHVDPLAAESRRLECERREAAAQQQLRLDDQKRQAEREREECNRREREREAQAEEDRRRETQRLRAEQLEAERRNAEREREARERIKDAEQHLFMQHQFGGGERLVFINGQPVVMGMGGMFMGGGMSVDDDDFGSLRRHHSHSSSRSSQRSAPLSWNEFRTANAGRGWSRDDFSAKYQSHKRRHE